MPTQRAFAGVMVLVGEPFGPFGTMMPVGHTAVYLDRVCADGPLKLRLCEPGEPQGVVIARYHRVGKIDWIASPVMEFLYASERAEDIPTFVTQDLAWERRQRYRRQYLSEMVPDGTEKDKQTDEWWESAGVAFNRRVWGYGLETSREQDERFVATMNARPNVHAYAVRKRNCANFAADMVNLYFPGTVEVDKWADFGLMTPKQVARSVAAYGEAHPEAGLRVVEVPQIPGTLRRSRPVRGTAEAGLKTKRYLVTLLMIQPEVVAGCAIAYLKHGRWKVGDGAVVAEPELFQGSMQSAAVGGAGVAGGRGALR
ncbi:DUF4105 domain-containing protein [Granulicella sp. dw_53]|uniref:DUF4105 domain-containing protein n=1 Tax=Granulicella sp. dw_53 TaxID=2719792 RepID=UPI001BD42055|nr:DUF4105 domain-containing protein [Granulicella sp. dw_53]